MGKRIIWVVSVLAFVIGIGGCGDPPTSTREKFGAAPPETVQYKVQSQRDKEFNLDDAIFKHRERAKADPEHVIDITKEEEKYLKSIAKEDACGILGLKVITEKRIPVAKSVAVKKRQVQADNGQNQVLYPQNLTYGDHLVMMRELPGTWGVVTVWHHAIVVEPGSNPWCIDYPNVGMEVEYITYSGLEDWTKRQNGYDNYAIYKLESPLSFNGYEASRRAMARYQLSAVEHSETYIWSTNNCEHLVRWCRQAVSYSSQAPLYQGDRWSVTPFFNEGKIVYRTSYTPTWIHLYHESMWEFDGWYPEYSTPSDTYWLEKEEAHLKRGPGPGLVPLYRKDYYENGAPRDALLTTNPGEAWWFQDKGVIGHLSTNYLADPYYMTRPLWRLYSPQYGHLFTTNTAEYLNLRNNGTWWDEGRVGYTW